jgi:hypothetical protein
MAIFLVSSVGIVTILGESEEERPVAARSRLEDAHHSTSFAVASSVTFHSATMHMRY